jgi:hypothetical protein
MVDTFKGFEWMSSDGHNGDGQWWTWVRYNFVNHYSNFIYFKSYVYICNKITIWEVLNKEENLENILQFFQEYIYMCHMIWFTLDN